MANDSGCVFLLWHTNSDNDNDAKLIGVYSTQQNAKGAVLSLKKQPGFKEHPEGFEICPYRLDMTSWTEGFVTMKTPVRKLRAVSPVLAAGRQARPGERPSTPARAGARGRTLKKKKRKS